MKLLTFKYNGKTQVGFLENDRVYTIEKYSNMVELINNATAEELSSFKADGNGIPYADIEKCAPIPNPAQDIICLGVNYAAHAEESARFKKELYDKNAQYPVYFSKRVDEAVADGGFIESHSDMVDSLDYESELAVIIKGDVKNVSEEDAHKYVFGYTILNDVSARNVQTRHKQWYFGKSLSGFCPMGPYIVTADEIAYPPKLDIRSRINGELRQDSNTSLLLFGIDYVISELSRGMTIKSGSIISMGTPAGVGMGFTPPKFLKAGDKVECEIEKIGVLTNIVK
ncbi:MAG: fumarylacetoacetate hydrolase family protein [Lachnospiraceae bacterium]|nr:fumarylacetoacetate hydrolase family protein [Lachnospiraceae bacterium]